MTEMQKVIKSFEEQIASGYTCVDKLNKYAKDIRDNYPDWYNGNKYFKNADWCTVFFDWNFIHALGEDRAREVLHRPKKSCGAGVSWSRSYLKEIGRVGNEPKVGCAVYFGDLPLPHHIGFVYKVTDDRIYTYEGNCYVSSNVTGVKAKSYLRTYSDILDYGYPVYNDEPGPDPDPDPKELDGFKVGSTYQVTCNDPLMIRKGAGKSYATTGELNKGDKILCKALKHDADLNTWLEHDKGWSCGLYQGQRYMEEVSSKTGWTKKNGKWYYYDKNGQMVKDDWQQYKGSWYYLGSDGAMLTGWQTINGFKYYFYPGDDGHRAEMEWVDGLFLDATGRQTYAKKGVWKKDDKGEYFRISDGQYMKDRCMRINKKDYTFDKDGYLIK